MKTQKVTKAMLYQDMQQEGYLLPKINSTICNLAYLFKIRNGLEYCPMEEEVQNITCENPPKRLLLLVYIQDELEKNMDARTMSFDEKHLPDVDWCLKALSALDPLHQIFEPDYLPPIFQRGRRGIRFIPSAEDFLFQKNFQQQKNSTNQNVFQNFDKDVPTKNISQNSKTQSGIQIKNLFQEEEQKDIDLQSSQVFKANSTRFQAHQAPKNKKDIKTNEGSSTSVGPLVMMLQELDDRGLLQECMQNYIDIQNQYDKDNQKKQDKETGKVNSKVPQQKDINSDFQNNDQYIFSTKSEVKHRKIQFNLNNKRKQFTEAQSPSKLSLKDELRQIKYNVDISKDLSSNQKTQASSDNKANQLHSFSAKQYDEDPMMIEKKVRAYGTPDSKAPDLKQVLCKDRSRIPDAIMKNDEEELVNNANTAFQDVNYQEDSHERADHYQPQNLKETSEKIFNI